MSHTHRYPLNFLHRHLTLAALVVGILAVGASSNTFLFAQLTGGGATPFTLRAEAATQETLHSAALAPVTHTFSVQDQLLLGMLLILMGFVSHLLYIKRIRRHVMIVSDTEVYPQRTFFTEVAVWLHETLDRPLSK